MLLVAIKVSPEVANVLLIASAVVILLALVAAFVGRFGKKGWIAVGSVVALLVAGAGTLALTRRVERDARAEAKLAGIRKVVTGLRLLAADTAPAEGTLRGACASSGMRFGQRLEGGAPLAAQRFFFFCQAAGSSAANSRSAAS